MKGTFYFTTLLGYRVTIAAAKVLAYEEVKWSWFYWKRHTKFIMETGHVYRTISSYDEVREVGRSLLT